MNISAVTTEIAVIRTQGANSILIVIPNGNLGNHGEDGDKMKVRIPYIAGVLSSPCNNGGTQITINAVPGHRDGVMDGIEEYLKASGVPYELE